VEGTLAVVRGRLIEGVAAAEMRRTANAYARVVVDVGTGDGRWLYRTARAHPEWLCLGLDADAGMMREASRRASRDPSRGGAGNLWFFRIAAEALPAGLEELADHISILCPWGSLLRAVLAPEVAVLRRVASVGKPSALVEIRVNASAYRAAVGLDADDVPALYRRLQPEYARAGIALTSCQTVATDPRTSWERRVRKRRHLVVVQISGLVLK